VREKAAHVAVADIILNYCARGQIFLCFGSWEKMDKTADKPEHLLYNPSMERISGRAPGSGGIEFEITAWSFPH
jgi:hypothetical protein